MPVTRLLPMSDEAVTEWSASRSATGQRFPHASEADRLDVLEIEVDGVLVGGVALALTGGEAPSVSIRVLETTLPDDATEHWLAVIGAIERHAQAFGARTLVTAVPVRLATVFQQAGFGATMTGVGTAIDPASERLTPETDRVGLRRMDREERGRFVQEAREFVGVGMARAGVLADPRGTAGTVERRLGALAGDPPQDEILLVVTDDGADVGRVWCTRVERDDEPAMVINTIDLAPEHRGQGLTPLLLSALETYAREHDLRDVSGRVYAQHHELRGSLAGFGVGTDEVHLRKDFRPFLG